MHPIDWEGMLEAGYTHKMKSAQAGEGRLISLFRAPHANFIPHRSDHLELQSRLSEVAGESLFNTDGASDLFNGVFLVSQPSEVSWAKPR